MCSCEHLEITDEGICKSCGLDITSQEFMDSLPEVPEDANFGDIMGIIRVAEDAAAEFLLRQSERRDPANPSQPKIQWVGTQMMRPPRETVFAEVVQPAFLKAKILGYRGNYKKWEVMCLEYVMGQIEKNLAKK